ncbi:hypothetical protein MMC32_005001, partial [Xylographa parallela]|nr:hypothetical protein [Xylographa parallela]
NYQLISNLVDDFTVDAKDILRAVSMSASGAFATGPGMAEIYLIPGKNSTSLMENA